MNEMMTLIARNCVIVHTLPDAVQCTFSGQGLVWYSGKSVANVFTCTLRDATGAPQYCRASDLRCVITPAHASTTSELAKTDGGTALASCATASIRQSTDDLSACWQITYTTMVSHPTVYVRVFAYDVLLWESRATGLFDVADARTCSLVALHMQCGGMRGLAVNPSCTRLVATCRCNLHPPRVYGVSWKLDVDDGELTAQIDPEPREICALPRDTQKTGGLSPSRADNREIPRVWSHPCFTSDTTLILSSNHLHGPGKKNDLYHVDLDGHVLSFAHIADYDAQNTFSVAVPQTIIAEDALVVVGGAKGLHIYSVATGGALVLEKCFKIGDVRALCFAGPEHFCVSNRARTVMLELISRETGIVTRSISITPNYARSIAMRADGAFIVISDEYCIHAYTADGHEVPCTQTYNKLMFTDVFTLHAQRLITIATPNNSYTFTPQPQFMSILK